MIALRQVMVPFFALALCQQATAAGQPCLSASKDIDAFLAQGEGRRFFAITGIVEQTSFKHEFFILRDAFGRCRCQLFRTPCPEAGDIIAANGIAHVELDRECGIVVRKIEKLGRGEPEPTIDIPLTDLDEQQHNLVSIRTTGTVLEVSDDEIDKGNCFLLLRGAGTVMPVACPANAKAELLKLVDAEVRVTGIFNRTVSGIRKYSGPFINLSRNDAVAVITPPPVDAFDAPPLEKRIYLTPREVSRLGRRTVCGRVLAVWGNDNLMIREADGRISHAQLAEHEKAPRVNTTGVVVGYPETDLFRIILTRARFKPTDADRAPDDTPEDKRVDAMFNASWQGEDNMLCHGRLIRIRGSVRSIPSPYDKSKRLLLLSDGHQVQVEISANPEIADLVPPDSEIEVVGRCLLETDNWHADAAFPRIKGLVIVPRTSADIRITARPPWWTPGRLLAVIAVLIVALLGLFGKNRLQKRLAQNKMADRTRLAVELHDSISQNLTGASLQIDAVGKLIDTDRAKALKRLELASKTLVSCHQELRNCIWDLRNNALDDKDMTAAVRKTVEPHVGDAELSVRFNVPRDRLSDNAVHATLRIIRELATNAARHGLPTSIRIAGTLKDERLLVSVSDDGLGFDPENRPGIREGHFGLQGVEERVAELGGELSVESETGKGTRITLWIRSRC